MPKRKRQQLQIKEGQNKQQKIEERSALYRVISDIFYDLTPYLTTREIATFSHTSKAFNGLFEDSLLWKQRYQNRFGFLYIHENYRAQYIAEQLWQKMLHADQHQDQEKCIAYANQLHEHLGNHTAKKWTYYYSSILARVDGDNTKAMNDGMQALVAGDIRAGYILIQYFNGMKYRDISEYLRGIEYDEPASQQGALQLFEALSKLINNNVPVSVDDYSRLCDMLESMPRQSENEKDRCVEIMTVFCLIYFTLSREKNHYDAHATQLYASTVYLYLNDNVNKFIDLTIKVTKFIDPDAEENCKHFKKFCVKTKMNNVVEVAGAALRICYNEITPLIVGYLEKCANGGSATGAYFYANYFDQYDEPEKAVYYYKKAIEGKEYRAVSRLYDIVTREPDKEHVETDVLNGMLREAILHGDIICTHTLAINIINHSRSNKWDEDDFNIWVVQRDACMTEESVVEVIFGIDYQYSLSFLDSECSNADTPIFVQFARAMVYAIRGDQFGPTDHLLLSAIENNATAFQLYLDAGKQYGFYTPAIDEVVRRVFPAVADEMQIDSCEDEALTYRKISI